MLNSNDKQMTTVHLETDLIFQLNISFWVYDVHFENDAAGFWGQFEEAISGCLTF